MKRPPVQQRIDAELNDIIAERDTALRLPACDEKLTRLAALFTREADLWGELHETTTSTTQARAAIRARQYAMSEAARWRPRICPQPITAA
jgi:hypothetical protein